MCVLVCPGRFFFFFNDTATTEIYTLSLHDALPICGAAAPAARKRDGRGALGRMDGLGIRLCRRAADAGRRHRGRAVAAEADRRACAPEARDRTSFRVRYPDQRQMLSSVAD